MLLPLPRRHSLRELLVTGQIATLLLPVFLLHARTLGEICLALAGFCFLWRCGATGNWAWLRLTWVRIGLVWWAWLVACSVPGIGSGGWLSFAEAVDALRFLVFAAALETDILADAAARRWLLRVVIGCAVYIAANVLIQFAGGANLYGAERNGDGELTGPFDEPRAGPPMVRILFPAIVPAICAWLAAGRRWPALGAYALLLGGVAIMVLIGQRMPAVLTGLGLVTLVVLLPALRRPATVALVSGLVLVAATVAVSPPTYYRLVQKFSAQMETFASSPYGLIYTRAAAMAEEEPVTGRGYDGFRTGCADPAYEQPSLDGRVADGGGTLICTTHPHNFYLQAVSDAGVPGLLLFCALVVAWLAPLWRAARRGDPLCVALFASVLLQLWPFASTSGFYTLPMAGWLFLTLGWGLAEARDRPRLTSS